MSRKPKRPVSNDQRGSNPLLKKMGVTSRNKRTTVKVPRSSKAKIPKPAAPKKPTFTSLYASIVKSKTPFNPEIDPVVFAQICSLFCKEQPQETAGYFNWDEETNLINWNWADPEDNNQQYAHVDYGTAKMRMAWESAGNEGIPNGQWHTHPGLSVYWSPTDQESQLRFCAEIVPSRPNGYFCFIVIDELDWLATRLVWEDEKIVYKEDGNVHINGVPLKGVNRPAYKYTSFANNGYTYYNNNKSKVVAPPPPQIQKPTPGYVKVIKNADQFKGEIAKEDVYYSTLFDIFFIPYYDWVNLYVAIEEYYPGQYDDIINESVSWNWLRADHDAKEFNDSIYGL